MARPRRSEKTKEQLIEQGISLFSENGYHGTGLKQILDSVNVPKGSFYNYFESKEQFAAEIITVYSSALIAQFEAYVENAEGDPITLINEVYSIMISEFERMGCHKGCLVGNLAAELGGSSEVCQKSMLETLSRWKARFVPLIKAAQAAKQIRDDVDAEDFADLFWNTWEGGILRMKIDGHTQSVRKSLDILINTLLKNR